MADTTAKRLKIRCACGARINVPVSAVGRRGKCPKCHRPFVVREPLSTPPPPESPLLPPLSNDHQITEPAAQNIVVPCACGRQLLAPPGSAGHQGKCPNCGQVLAIPTVPEPGAPARLELAAEHVHGRDAESTESTERQANDDWLLNSLSGGGGLDGSAGASPSLSGGVSVGSAGKTKTCPSCQKPLAANAVICVECGISVKTGRPLLTADEESLDKAYTYAESLIRVVSWLIPLGVYPIASEAFGLRKPWVTRGIAALTIAVSAWFMVVYEWSDDPSPAAANLMLWTGRAQPNAAEIEPSQDELIAKLKQQGLSEEQIRRMLAMVAGSQAPQGEFRPYQLFTCALLHGGPLHLAGNLLFLLVLGSRVNALIGNILTILCYPLLAFVAGVAHMAASSQQPLQPMLGASGAVMGLAGMYLVLFPVHKVHMAFWYRWGLIGVFHLNLKVFAVRGFLVVLFYIAFDVLFTYFGIDDNVAHWAHLGGFLGGVALALTLLLARLVDARGGDLLSAVLGRFAWGLIGKPSQPRLSLW